MTYTPDGKTRELLSLLVGDFAFFQVTAGNHIFGDAPADWSPKVREAIQLKQRGEYLRAAEILTSLMLDAETLYTQLTDILFEVQACAGLVKLADQYLCHMIQTLDMAALTHLVPVYKGKLREFVAAFESEVSLRGYLSQLCGNPEYRLPKSYAELKADLDDIMRSSIYAAYHKDRHVNDDRVTLIGQGDGSHLVAPTSTSTYLPDGKFDELRSLVKTFLTEFDETLKKGLGTSSAAYPTKWEDRLRQAVELKRRGEFLESARIYVDLSRTSGTVYTGILNNLYKTVASAGDLLNGNFILMRGLNIYGRDPHGPSVDAGIASNFADHLSRLTAATESPTRLKEYLRTISGNPAYYLPRDYEAMVGELRSYYEQIAQLTANLQKAEKRASGGCYVATAVYGSYDCPEVWVLRRFRDQTLATAAPGRAFISAYYLTSRIVLRLVGKHGGQIFRRPIAALVRTLKARGYSDEPYADTTSRVR